VEHFTEKTENYGGHGDAAPDLKVVRVVTIAAMMEYY
jgi:hypothetical protein